MIIQIMIVASPPARRHETWRTSGSAPSASGLGRTLEAPIPKMSGLVKKVGPFSKRTNPL